MGWWQEARSNIRNSLKWVFSKPKKPVEESVNFEGVAEKVVEPEPVTERVRTRTIKGRYVADDKSTPDIDEAWTTRKVKVKRTKKYKK
jgi:hypothetical protein